MGQALTSQLRLKLSCGAPRRRRRWLDEAGRLRWRLAGRLRSVKSDVNRAIRIAHAHCFKLLVGHLEGLG